MIIKRKETQTSDAECNSSSPSDLPDPSSQTQFRLPFHVTPPGLHMGHDVLWCGISLWSVWVSCPSYAPSWFCLHTPSTASLAEHNQGKKNSLT